MRDYRSALSEFLSTNKEKLLQLNCPINGVIMRELKRFHDNRGWLTELFRNDELAEEFFPVMCYLSMTKPGVARGPHEHVDQAD